MGFGLAPVVPEKEMESWTYASIRRESLVELHFCCCCRGDVCFDKQATRVEKARARAAPIVGWPSAVAQSAQISLSVAMPPADQIQIKYAEGCVAP